MSLYQQCPGSKNIKSPYPEEIKCSCGSTMEIWSDEASAVCRKCKSRLTRQMLPSCLDWCAAAKECIGGQKYKNYLEAKQFVP